ncbi:unnamed protein product [Cylindrotheca closterium]|uniref:ZZ-type domain-containing protein n=1 Tax=Cylindrotheca closterium TaxID=2856 RepID=A0AAD2G9Q9_9STRA|nr:unnamed protein product [Cylindrotheca closterium]
MPPFQVDQYEDFVLKLKIKAADGTSQIRRVRLPRIADGAGNVSYEELVGLVVTFTFPAESSSSPENFDCVLTYFDEDEDTVTIASTSELVDAVEQFVDKKVLRISTEVKRKTSAGASIPQTTQSSQPSSGTADRGTSTQPESLEANLQIVLESFASVVVTAVSSLEKGLAANSASNTAAVSASTPSSENNPKGSEKVAKPVIKSAPQFSAVAQFAESQKPEVKEQLVPHVHKRHTCDSCLMNPIVGARYHALNMTDYDLCQNCYPNYSGKETEFVTYPTGNKIVRKNSDVIQDGANGSTSLSSEEEAGLLLLADVLNPAAQEAAAFEPASKPGPSSESTPCPIENSLPFIHGRHTCDSCLMNPIIGKRYHAINMKDYDLCEKCYPNYQGTEIQLEAVELSRDRAFQKRWNRRRERIDKMNRKRPGRRCRDRKSPEFALEPPRPQPASQPNPEPTPTPPPSVPAQESTARVIPIQSSAPTTNPADDFDGALKEAIRRSLEDAMPKEIQEMFEPTEPMLEPTEPIIAPSAPTEEEVLTMCGATNIVNDSDTPTSALEAEVVEDLAITEEGSRASSSMVEVDEQRLLDSMTEDNMSVDSEDMMRDDFDMKLAAVDRETSMSTPERKSVKSSQANTPGSNTDDSFALDAVGNGDIAEAMGATLDIVAGVISEMLTEADAHNATAVLDEVIASTMEKSEPEVVEPEADATEEAGITDPGALIVGSEEATEDPKEEVDGWQVVDENTNESTDIASATQMLGSVLFNSDMRSSEVMGSANSGVLSAASSVPSDLPSVSVGTEGSHGSEAQRNRWASQLYMMREMGFENEAKCIETLERLQAANIGCGEEDEVSVTQAVEAMLSELK